jgi:hypothetical protein
MTIEEIKENYLKDADPILRGNNSLPEDSNTKVKKPSKTPKRNMKI